MARCGGSWQDTRDGAVVRNGVVVLLAEGWRRKKREKKGVNGGDRQRLAPKLELWWDFGLKIGGGSDQLRNQRRPEWGSTSRLELEVGTSEVGAAQRVRAAKTQDSRVAKEHAGKTCHLSLATYPTRIYTTRIRRLTRKSSTMTWHLHISQQPSRPLDPILALYIRSRNRFGRYRTYEYSYIHSALL